MVHVVYLGAVSNGGSWWRMHKALQQDPHAQNDFNRLRAERPRESGRQVRLLTDGSEKVCLQ